MNEGDSRACEVLEVFSEPAAASHPGQRTLDDPAFGQDPERVLVLAPDDLEAPRTEPGHRCGGGFAGIGAIGDDAGQTPALCGDALQHEGCTVPVLNAGRMDGLGEDQAERVDEDVALLAPDLLCRVIARRIDARPPFSAPLTL